MIVGNKPYERFEEAIRAKQPIKLLLPIQKIISWIKGKEKSKGTEIANDKTLWDRWRFRGRKMKKKETLIQQLIRHEGMSKKPYYCFGGKLTIGVGRNLDDVGITEDEALYLLRNDIESARDALTQKLSWFPGLDEARQGVLINMCVNLGVKGLMKFKKTLALIENKYYEEASREMLKSKWAKQVGNRAVELSKIMATGGR